LTPGHTFGPARDTTAPVGAWLISASDAPEIIPTEMLAIIPNLLNWQDT
jgi:hypothetical protein